MNRKIRILYIDDSELDRELVKDALEKEHGGFELTEASNKQEFESFLQYHVFDAVLSDFNIAGFEGLQVIKAVKEHDSSIPVIIVTGTGSEEIAVDALKQGATDYVIKRHRHIQKLPQTILAALENKELKDQRALIEASLKQSEEKFRNIAENSLVGFYIIQDDVFHYVNPKFADIFGYSVEECLDNMRVLQLVHPDDLDMVREQVRTRLSGETDTARYSFRGLKKDGTSNHVEIYGSSMFLNGKPAATGTMLDITDRKEAEKALKESEKRYRQLFNSIRDAILVADTDRRIVDCNQAFKEKFGFGLEDIKGEKTICLYDSEEEYEKMGKEITKHINRPHFVYTINYKKKSGEIFPGETNVYYLRDIQGEIIGLIGMIRDVTTKLKAEEDAKKIETQLRQAQKMESIGTLAGGIAHDFNNILTSIIGYTELALDEAGKDTTIRDELQEVRAAGNRAKDLVKQILSIGRHDEKETKPILITPLIKETLKMLRSTLPSSIEFQDNISNDPLIVQGDPTQIHQVIVNLATNAKQAMSDGTGVLAFEVGAVHFESDIKDRYPDMRPGDYVRISISDTGTGIPEEHLDKIFEPYFTTKEKEEGTGLGLSVVHGIVKSHKGHINVYSEPGKGTTLNVYLPLVQKASVDAPDQDAEPLPGGAEHILLIDDEPPIAKMLQQGLERLGYRVTSRTSSIEALELFRIKMDEFDLVITDMTMPNMTGDKLAGELKAIRADIPVILCTGFSEKINGREDNPVIDAFLMKPVDKRSIARIVRELLDTGRFVQRSSAET